MNADERPAPWFGSLHHVALVVEDLEETVARLERLGFGPFVAYPALDEYVDLEVPDREAFLALRIRVASLGPVELQVIEAADSKTIYGDFLRERGEGIFHLGFRVENVDEAEREAVAGGLRRLSRGRRADGSGFTYFDTLADLGVALLVRQNRPDDPG